MLPKTHLILTVDVTHTQTFVLPPTHSFGEVCRIHKETTDEIISEEITLSNTKSRLEDPLYVSFFFSIGTSPFLHHEYGYVFVLIFVYQRPKKIDIKKFT